MHCKSVRRVDVLISLKISSLVLGPVHTTLGKLKIAGFTLKTHQMPEEFKNATIIVHFEFFLEEDSGREITWLS